MGDPREFRWYDLSQFALDGQGWTGLSAAFDRLPARAQPRLRPELWERSREPAGLSVTFQTDAPEIHARWTLSEPVCSAVPRWSAMGMSGVDLYARDQGGAWRWAGVSTEVCGPSPSCLLVGPMTPTLREFRLYLPLAHRVETIAIGVPHEAQLLAVAPSVDPPIVFYGTSITQGWCASRAGMTYAAILGRRLDRPVLNLGFAGQGRMDLEMAELMGELTAAVFVIDALPNMTGPDVESRAEPFLRQLCAAQPRVPIIVVDDRSWANGWLVPLRRGRNARCREALWETASRLRDAGLSHLHALRAEDLYGADDEGLVDGSHPSDLGFMRMSDRLEPLLKALAPAPVGPAAPARPTTGTRSDR